MLALIASAMIVTTNAPVLIPLRGRADGQVEFSCRSLVERRRFVKIDGGRTNNVWKTGREFPVMFERCKKK
jgi:hypothetical protein